MRHTPTFVLSDVDEVRRLIRENPWATIVSHTAAGIVASHYPVVLEPADPADPTRSPSSVMSVDPTSARTSSASTRRW